MFAADTQVQIRVRRTTILYSQFDELSDTLLIQRDKRVTFKNLLFAVFRQERTGVITRESEAHLREVVGTEGEELCSFSNFTG